MGGEDSEVLRAIKTSGRSGGERRGPVWNEEPQFPLHCERSITLHGRDKKRAKLLQSCPTLHNSMNYSLQGSSVHGILQERLLEWVEISSFRGSSRPRDRTCVSSVFCLPLNHLGNQDALPHSLSLSLTHIYLWEGRCANIFKY